ncbi:MAG: glycerol-3-phosphate dehydrogenase/oxidase [Bacteroidia bacterium]
MNSFSSKNRAKLIDKISSTSFDLLVIGGGITGAGIALDASARGLKVALVEMQDFASGTSGRSTKLIHGGLRYLKQLEFGLVAEVGKEREIVHKNAPHLTKPEPMLLPIVRAGSLNKFSARLAMFVYELIAGVKKEERRKILSKDNTLQVEPLLKKEDVLGGILFYEYRTDDARLTIEVMKAAVSRGALSINYMEAASFIYESGEIKGAHVTDKVNGGKYTIAAKYVINASGPWVDAIDDLDEKKNKHKLQVTKGIHLVVDWKKLPVKQSAYFDTYDRRMLFVIPREGKTYIGTTDTFYSGNLSHPNITKEDRDYILKCVNDYFPGSILKSSDIESGWCGLRPLVTKPGKKPSEISRKDEIFESASGLITIAGGKLTGYRKMAQRIVDIVAKKITEKEGGQVLQCNTQNIRLPGGEINNNVSFPAFVKNKVKEGINLGLSEKEAETLVNRYGSNVEKIYEIVASQKDKNRSGVPLILSAQLIYCLENEMCLTPSDFLIRRTGSLYFDIDTVQRWGGAVAKEMQNILGWNDELTERFTKELYSSVEEAEKIKLI